MQKIHIDLPHYRLLLEFKFIKRRKSLVEEALIPHPQEVKRKYRKGNLLQKFARHIFEHKKINKFLGTNLALIAIVSSFLPTGPVQAGNSGEAIISPGTTLVTQPGSQYPTQSVKITQGYRFLHTGIDLDGVTGDPIKPIKPGRVLAISSSKYAYGNSVIVDHGNQLTSLYAHLAKIEVEVGQEVTMETEIGKMGRTGRASGDHLHLEIRDHGVPINPLLVLPR